MFSSRNNETYLKNDSDIPYINIYAKYNYSYPGNATFTKHGFPKAPIEGEMRYTLCHNERHIGNHQRTNKEELQYITKTRLFKYIENCVTKKGKISDKKN